MMRRAGSQDSSAVNLRGVVGEAFSHGREALLQVCYPLQPALPFWLILHFIYI